MVETVKKYELNNLITSLEDLNVAKHVVHALCNTDDNAILLLRRLYIF